MSAPNTTPKVPLSAALVDQLTKVVQDLPNPVVGDAGLLAEESTRVYDAVLAGAPELQYFVEGCRLLLANRYGEGCVVINAAPILDEAATDDSGKILTVLMSWLGTPLRPFGWWPLWKPLGANLALDPMHTTGTGYSPFHIDIVNATLPPDFSALLCVRPDPCGGGHSLISHLRRAVARLSSEERARLSEVVYRGGKFYDSCGVGEEYSPFPVLDNLPLENGFVRFTAKMLSDMESEDPHAAAVRALEHELVVGQHRLLLERGDLLVVNQHLSAHARDPFGEGQREVVAEGRSRLLWQMFLRTRRVA
ncbi:TauD/TfdA family dioxygenase [Streptomyces lasiicapitis]|uniref:TauD/TfdA family dioxygenase n=1 Tax=Streptomyces lasiicapitis TaxID=1923961 RepID=UPI00331B86F6